MPADQPLKTDRSTVTVNYVDEQEIRLWGQSQTIVRHSLRYLRRSPLHGMMRTMIVMTIQ